MLKCGQKDNKNYTFGVRKEQIEKEAEVITKCFCSGCGKTISKSANFCPNCGVKV